MTTADIILNNANIITLDARQPRAEAVAVKGDSIGLVGGNADAATAAGAGTRVIDCAGRTVVPGFNDAISTCSLY